MAAYFADVPVWLPLPVEKNSSKSYFPLVVPFLSFFLLSVFVSCDGGRKHGSFSCGQRDSVIAMTKSMERKDDD